MARLSPTEGFEVLKNKVTTTVSGLFPIVGKRHTLSLDNVQVKDDLDLDDIRSQKAAKVKGRTWAVPVEANVSLVDNASGNTVDKQKLRLMSLPKHTRRYTQIVDGQEYQINNQWRLKSGIYSRVRDNGQLESQFNLAKGRGFHLRFDPESRQMNMEYGTSNIPLQPLIRELGVPHEEIEKTWGKDITAANQQDQTKAVMKFFKASTGEKAPDLETAREHLFTTFNETELRPDTTKMTLGQSFKKVDGNSLIAASQRLLQVSQGKAEPDARDALPFKELHSTEDFFAERIQKGSRDILRKIQNNIDRRSKVRDVVGPDVFNKPVRTLFRTTLAEIPTQTNPLEMMSNQMKTTITGEGGIKSAHGISEEAKLIDPSHLGYLDPIHTPEGCFDDQTEVFTKAGWKFWSDVVAEDLLACRIEGSLEFHVPQKLIAAPYIGKMYGVDTTRGRERKKRKIDYLVTPNHRIYSRPHDIRIQEVRWRIERADSVHEKTRVLQLAHKPFVGENEGVFPLPYVQGNNSSKNIDEINFLDWAQFMGWYLSEGSFVYDEESSSYGTSIHQSVVASPVNCKIIEALLDRLPFTWGFSEREDGKRTYTIHTKQLASYVSRFGKSGDKFVEDYFFDCSIDVREHLLECLLFGDGRIDSNRSDGSSYSQDVYCTTSPRLAEGVEKLAVGLGHAVSVGRYEDCREERFKDVYEIRLLVHSERMISGRKGHFYTTDYDGMIYCAEVPGGLLYVRRKDSLAHWSGNSATGVTLRLPLGAKKKGHDVVVRMHNLKTGKMEDVNPEKAMKSNIILPDQVSWKDGKPVGAGTLKISGPGNELTTGSLKKADYVMKDPMQLFSIGSNMVPFIAADHPNRSTMAGRHMEQAIPLANREAPLVQSMAPKGSFDQFMGSFAGHKALKGGTVTKITNEGIHIKDAKGKTQEVQVYNHFPLNDDKGFIHSTPNVAVGDKVKRGQTLADTNFTKNGVLAMGANLRTAYMPFKGYNFEDGVVISETAANKMSSEHMHRKTLDTDKSHVLSKSKFQAYQPDSITRDQAVKLDDDGVVMPGMRVTTGDTLIAALQQKTDRVEDKELAKLHKSLVRPFKDASVKWESDYPGEVVEVVKRGRKTAVHVKTLEPMEVGDKVAGRHGNKGIVCFSEDSQVLTDSGWKTWPVEKSDLICTRNPDTGIIEYQSPTNYIARHYQGKMYLYEGRRLNLCVTPEHNHYVRTRRGEFCLMSAESCFGLPRIHLRTGVWEGLEIESVHFEGRPPESRHIIDYSDDLDLDADLFLEFFGFWITEGHLSTDYCTVISQSKEAHPDIYDRIVEVVESLGFTPKLSPNTIIISDIRLVKWLKQFGKAHDKFIPREFLGLSQRQLRIMADSIFQGDGGVYYREKDNHTRYELFTSSQQLSDDYQELAFKLGFSANIKSQPGEYGIEYVVRWSLKDEVWTNNDKRYNNEQWIDYDGMIYCVEVPNHIIYVRRKGIPVWSGNCKIIPDAEMPITGDGTATEILLNPCYDDETEFLTHRGWILGSELRDSDVFATVDQKSLVIEFQEPEEVYRWPYTGKMYQIKSQQLDMVVTPNHRQFVAPRTRDVLGTLDLNDPPDVYRLEEARDIEGQPRRYLKAGGWKGYDPHFFVVPAGNPTGGGKPADGFSVPSLLWAEFMGWFLSEGSTYFNSANYGYCVEVSQSTKNLENRELISDLLECMGVSYGTYDKGFVITHKGLYELLHPLGGCDDKYIPRQVLDLPRKHLAVFLDRFIRGDGHEKWDPDTGHYGNLQCSSNSFHLAGGLQEIAMKLGMACNIKEDPRTEKYRGGHHYCLHFSPSRRAPWVNWSEEAKKSQVEEWVDYDGVVYCAKVPNGTLVVRRHGKPVISGNTGVPSRTNLGQILETAAGKIAEKTGKTYQIKNFQPGVDLHAKVSADLKKHGLTDKETVFDPITKRPMGSALVGNQHIIKLRHQVEKKLVARAGGPGYAYDRNMIPKGGGPHGAQALGTLGLYSMLAHGATENLREMQTVKCFTWNTPIITDRGVIQIGKIVNQSLDVQVLSRNPATGVLEFKPVVNYWKRRIEDEEAMVVLAFYSRDSSGAFKQHTVRCTSAHEIYVEGGHKIHAGDALGQRVLVPALRPSDTQMSVLVGSLLGDGSLQVHNGPFPAFQERHSIKQKEYLEFKAEILGDFSLRHVRPYDAGSEGFNCDQEMCEWGTFAQPEFAELHSEFYVAGVKTVPADITNRLTPLALAIWYQDDGSLVYGNRQRILRIHTGVLPEEDRDRLIDALYERVGVRFTHCKDVREYEGQPHVQWSLRLGTEHEIDRFLDHVHPYIHPSMSYKVGCECGAAIESVVRDARALCVLTPTEVLFVRRYNPCPWDGCHLYDLEVKENHTYFANGLLVGNSDAKQNDAFWSALQAGEPLPTPRPTFAYEKFTGYLKGLGVNVTKQGNNLQLIPFTDKQVRAMSNGELKDAGRMVRAKDLRPEKGGLFDPQMTGGLDGDKWSHIKLPEPMPNPLFEKSVQSLTNMTAREYGDVIGGRRGVDPKTGKIVEPDKGLVGGKAFNSLLGKIDVKKELSTAKATLSAPGLKGNRLDRANKKVKYLRALDNAGLSVKDAYMTQIIPVMPPNMRPLSQLPNGDLNVDDLNQMYKGIALSSSRLKGMSKLLPEEEKNEVREEIYDGLRSLTGIGGHANREFRGVLDIIGGKKPDRDTGRKVGSPKLGFFQKKLVQRKQDLSMRSTIIPEPSLGLDEVGIPRKAALEIYKPFVVKELRNLTGMSPLDAQKSIREGGQVVNKALERAMETRPVLLKRDPVLHKYNIQGFRPKVVGGKAVQIHPLVTSGFNADFDGDQQINSVVALIPREVYNSDIRWEYRRCEMSARFKEALGYVRRDGFKGPEGIFVVCNLEDFPRERKIKTKGHIDFWSVPNGVRVVALDEETGMPVLADVSCWSLHRARKVEIVELGSGRQIITDDDERAVYGIDASSLQWCRRRPSESTNQFVPVLGSAPQLEPIRKTLPLPDDRRLRSEAVLDERFGYFLGAMVGDGWPAHANGDPKSINFSSEYDEVREAWFASLLSIFKEMPTITDTWTEGGKLGNSEGSMRYTVSCAAAAAFLAPIMGCGARNKHLPPFFVSAPLSFLRGLMGGLIDTDGSMSWSFGKDKPQFMCGYQSSSIRLLQELQHALHMIDISASITPSKTPKGEPFWALTISTVDLFRFGGFPVHHAIKKEAQREFLDGPPPDTRMAYSRYRLVPLPSAVAKELRSIVGPKDRSLYVTLSKATNRQYVSKETAKILVEKIGDRCGHPLYQRWKDLVLEESVHFERVKNVVVTEIEEDGYDLSVPGYETFMALDGTVLSNTMSAYVPVSHGAVEEAKRMAPSNNLFSPATGNLMYTPTLETQLGLYGVTQVGKKTDKTFKTVAEMERAVNSGSVGFNDQVRVGTVNSTPGRLMVAGALPGDMRSAFLKRKDPLDRRGQNQILSQVAKAHKNDYGVSVNKMKDLGNRWATETAFSVGMEDIKPEKAIRSAVLGKADREVAAVRRGAGTKKQKDSQAVKIYDRATQEMHAKLSAMPESRSNLMAMHNSGIKPGLDTLRQIKVAPMLVQNSKGEIIPTPIKGNYSEGLDVADYWTSMSGARKGIIQKVQSVAEPGYISKQVMNSTMNNVILDDDCGTDRGVALSTDEKDVMDRYLAMDTKAGRKIYKAGTMITPEVRNSLRNNRVKRVTVRSPLRCNHGPGLCKKCMGLMEDGKLPEVGTNVGVLAAQSLGERTTQLALKSFHTGGTAASAESLVDDFSRVKQMFRFPKTLRNSATLSTANGRVDDIERDPAGGHNVFINKQRHYIPQGLGTPMYGGKQLVKGMQVRKGDPISKGLVNPHEMLPLAGIERVQGHLSGELHGVFGEHGIRRRNVEVVVKSLTNLSKIEDPGDRKDFLRGDYAPTSKLSALNRTELKGKDPIKHVPVLRGVDVLPLDMQEDWVAKLNHERLSSTVQNAAQQGWASKLHGTHPIGPVVQGSDLARGDKFPWEY